MDPGEDIGEAEIDAAVARPRFRLSFAPRLERMFEDRAAEARCRRLILQNWVGLAIYESFMLGDYVLIRDRFAVSVALHLCVMLPIMVGLNAILARRPPVWLREGLLAGGIVLSTAAILGLMLISRSPLRTTEHVSVVLVILFATMVQRIRFGYVLAACLASAGLYVAALSQLTEGAPWERKAVAAAVFCGVVLFSTLGCWTLEREERTNFLLRLRDRIRTRKLEVLACRDALTGAGNRRALDEALALCRPSDADAAPTAVLLFDIDHFKSFNDDNGHLAGDACLYQVAQIVAANLREGALYRFGGEEFLAILEGVDAAKAHAIAERVRAAVAAAAIPRARGRDEVVTLSAGYAAGALSEANTIRHLIADADLALYAAKRAGRDQVRPAVAGRRAA